MPDAFPSYTHLEMRNHAHFGDESRNFNFNSATANYGREYQKFPLFRRCESWYHLGASLTDGRAHRQPCKQSKLYLGNLLPVGSHLHRRPIRTAITVSQIRTVAMAKKGAYLHSMYTWRSIQMIDMIDSKIPHDSRAPDLHGPHRLLSNPSATENASAAEHDEV